MLSTRQRLRQNKGLPDYHKLLDAQVWAFLARTERHYPPDAVKLTVAEQRQVYDAMCADFDMGRPEGLTVVDKSFAGVSCRVYTPPETVGGKVVFFHGGGFVVGGLDSHDSICAELSTATGLEFVAVDYRLSPEYPYPNDFNDAWAVFDEISQDNSAPLILCGDSAGGNLAAAVAHKARNEGVHPSGVLLIYPGLGGDFSWPSYIEHANAPGLSTKDMEFYSNLRSAGRDLSGDPYHAPLQDTDFSGLPPTVVITADCDPLASDGEVYCERINAAGGQALWVNEKGLVHAFLRARHMSAKARASFDRMIASLKSLSSGSLPDLT